MTQYRITTNSGKFRIEHFVENSKWFHPKSGWYPLIHSLGWFDTKQEAEKAVKDLVQRELMNTTPWEPV